MWINNNNNVDNNKINVLYYIKKEKLIIKTKKINIKLQETLAAKVLKTQNVLFCKLYIVLHNK